MKVRMMVVALLVAAATTMGSPAIAATQQSRGGYEIATITVTSAHAAPSVVEVAGPTGENLLCDKFYGFADEGGQFTLQHRCGGNTVPWGYRIAEPLRAIAVTPVTERGVDWTKNGVVQTRLSPHTEAADYFFHGTFPDSPDGTTITYTDRYSFRHNVSGGGEVNIDIKGAFTATGTRA